MAEVTTLRRTQRALKWQLAKATNTLTTIMGKKAIDIDASQLDAPVEAYEKAMKEYRDCSFEIMDHLDDTAAKAEEESLEAFENDYPDYANDVFAIKRAIEGHSTMTRIEMKLKPLEANLELVKSGAADARITELLHLVEKAYLLAEKEPLSRDGAFSESCRTQYERVNALEKAKGTSASDARTKTTSERDIIKFPKASIPKFDGDILTWPSFWQRFNRMLKQRPHLEGEDKLSLLREAIENVPEARKIAMSSSGSVASYEDVVARLKTTYDKKRTVYRRHVQNLTKLAPKAWKKSEVQRVEQELQFTLSYLRDIGLFDGDHIATAILVNNLPETYKIEWDKATVKLTTPPGIKDFLDFLLLAEAAAPEDTSTHGTKQFTRPTEKPKGTTTKHVVHVSREDKQCSSCSSKDHPTFACGQFKSMTVDKRAELIRRVNACSNCLAVGHYARECRSQARCKVCGKPHHTMLHQEIKQAKPSDGTTTGTVTVCPTAATPRKTALLQTCQVEAHGPNGNCTRIRALLDYGASLSIVSSRVTKMLSLPKTKDRISLRGLHDLQGEDCNYRALVELQDIHGRNKKISIDAVVANKVTSILPQSCISEADQWTHLKGLQLADPDYTQPGTVDLLLGSDVLSRIYTDCVKRGKDNQPVAYGTIFGWTVGGCRGESTAKAEVHVAVNAAEDANQILQKFWEAEQPPPSKQPLTKDEERAVECFQHTCEQTGEGRYQVQLPWKDTTQQLADSRGIAVSRFYRTEKSTIRRGVWDEFSAGVNEYLTMGHAEKVPLEDLSKPAEEVYYMAMHPVLKERSTTTKCRIVWDASGRSANGVSLNDLLLPGPSLLPPITDLVIKFRLHKLAFTADIAKMFRCVELANSDRDFHRFVWRSSQEDQLIDYRMTRVSFGVSSSPFLASMVLTQVAQDYKQLYPKAAEEVNSAFYVDDYLSGAETLQQAEELYREMTELMSRGQFQLRKWRSNSQELLQVIPSHLKETEPERELAEPADYHRTLGISWDTQKDCLYVVTPPLNNQTIKTKRQLTSTIARIYDVMGWLSPCTVVGKVLLQRLWRSGADWDEEPPKEILDECVQWEGQLSHLSTIPIQRCYTRDKPVQGRQLHGFADASEKAYAGVVYLRTLYQDTSVEIAIIMAKTKVAPVHGETLPRLELCGAVLVAKLMNHIKTVMNMNDSDIFLWSDSTIVLHWLSGDPKHFKTFAGNRIRQVLELTNHRAWRYVPSASNPADCATRGLLPSQLKDHHLWWYGPNWLSEPPSEWPAMKLPKMDAVPEMKANIHVEVAEQSLDIVERFSSLTLCIRVTARIRRWIYNCRHSVKRKGKISRQEYEEAEQVLIRQSQAKSFSTELKALQQNSTLPYKNSLLKYQPFLDEAGILRVGGRLEHSHLAYCKRHPILLHATSSYAVLLIRKAHADLLHGKPKAMNTRLSREYLLISGKQAIRKVWRQCLICTRHRARTIEQMMGQLPAARVNPSPPFFHTGVDYAGPVLLKLGNRRKPTLVKAYIAAFVCMVTKAIHLELVEDLTTEAFLACLDRFVSRRNVPSHIYSDHGTNFVGARNELQHLREFFEKEEVSDRISHYSTQEGIVWHMTPEKSPHFGGLWESVVRITKRHILRSIGDQKLTHSQYTTLLCKVEASVNSRPLIPASQADADGIEPLTPAHFLTGRPMKTVPDRYDGPRPPSLPKYWTLVQTMHRSFWTRFQNEYLQALNRMNKWTKTRTNVKVGDLVAIKDEGLDKKLTMGRIEAVYPGEDKLVRVASVKTSTGTYKRPVVKLVRLLRVEDT